MRIDPPLRAGDRVVVITADRRVPAVVVLAASSGRSLMLAFDALIGSYAGAMPVMQDDHGDWTALLDGMPLLLRRPDPDEDE